VFFKSSVTEIYVQRNGNKTLLLGLNMKLVSAVFLPCFEDIHTFPHFSAPRHKKQAAPVHTGRLSWGRWYENSSVRQIWV
jgi:hypothetical protein